MRCDDSVARIAAVGEQIFRRSRGYAPEPISLPFEAPMPLLACGGHLKNTFCLAKGNQAFVSHHIGDLENLGTLTSFREGIEHFKRLFDVYPQAVAYDLHPEYLATKYALDPSLHSGQALDVPILIGVQRHHAHIASVLAEHRLEGPVIGVAADGTGYGTDGIALDEQAILVRAGVRGACGILGLDPLTIANEGKLLAIVAAEATDAALQAMRDHPLGREAAIIGEVRSEPVSMVFLRTDIGGTRVLDMLVGDPLPRIC